MDEIQLRLANIDLELKRYNDMLDVHIKRTDLLEAKLEASEGNWLGIVDRLEKSQQNNQAFVLKLIAGIGTFIGVAVPLIIKLIESVSK